MARHPPGRRPATSTLAGRSPAALALALAVAACSRSNAAEAPPRAAPEPSSGAAMWGEGFFPNITLTTQLGARVRFFDDLIRDKVVAINFIYTRCTDACPMETARLLEVQKLLGDRLGRDVFFYSISIDPEHDTPEVLQAYAASWHTAPGWTFLTGAEADITLLRKKLGMYEPDLKSRDHKLSVVIGNQRTGRWMKRSPYENPYVLADQLGSWLHNWKLPPHGDRDYARAPEVRNISTGEELFRTRCAACHTIGGGDRADLAQRQVGPDLREVTRRRDHAWLVRWVMHPDEVLAARDPTALALLARYQGMVMPNLRISEGDAEAVLGYLATEGHAAPAAAPPHDPIVLPDPGARSIRAVLATYDALRRRLADDDLEGARPLAATIDATVAGRSALAAPIANPARQVASARELEPARRAFGELSRGVVGLLVDNPALRTGWWLYRCPMAHGYQRWIQADQTLTNPYFGTQMRTCGTLLASWGL